MLNELLPAWQKMWEENGFGAPTAIQEAVFTPLKEGTSVLGISPTGSGKTLAYLLPLMTRVQKGAGNQLLVLVSSQELAVQITNVAQAWSAPLDLKVQSLIGGANVKRQIEKLKERPEILVGTPGRVLELIKQKKLKSHLLEMIVMDEVDQLLAENHFNLIQDILRSAPREYQLAFFSATADRVLTEVTTNFSNVAVIDTREADQSAGEVHHYYLETTVRKKVDQLARLSRIDGFQAMVFFNQLADLGAAEDKLLYEGVPVVSLASDQNKQLRKMAIDRFKDGQASLLLTTDLGARGLDFAALPYVIMYEPPLSVESYIHRSGRVGRMGAAGTVITLLASHEKRDLQKITKEAGVALQAVYLHSRQLTTTRPEKETVATPLVKERQPKEKLHTVTQKVEKKQKKRKKNQKNKGLRRK